MSRVFAYSVLAIVGLKVCASFFTNFSLYGDEAQYWLWSQNLDFGYFSKPPLLAWFLSGHILLFGDTFFSLKMFPLLIYFLLFFAFYRLCLRLSLTREKSVICSFGFLLIPAATVSSFLISTDLLLLLFWVLAMTKLLETRKDGSVINFVLLGVFLGLAFLAKYAAVYFLLSFLILVSADKEMLSSLKSRALGWFIFALFFLLILLPNIYWNFNNSWVTFAHTSDNANLKNLNLNFVEPFKFLISQIFMVGPVLFLSFFYMFKFFRLDFENKFLLIFSLPIIIIVLFESFLVRANANWAAPALISLYILFFRLVVEKKKSLIIINFATNYAFAIFLFISILVSSDSNVFDRIRGVDVFVKEVLKNTGSKDLVISDRIIFSNVSYEIRGRPNKIYMPYKNGDIITNHFQMASPLRQTQGGDFYLIGNHNDIKYLLKKNQIKLLKEFNVPFNSTNLKFYEVVFK